MMPLILLSKSSMMVCHSEKRQCAVSMIFNKRHMYSHSEMSESIGIETIVKTQIQEVEDRRREIYHLYSIIYFLVTSPQLHSSNSKHSKASLIYTRNSVSHPPCPRLDLGEGALVFVAVLIGERCSL